VSGAAEHRVEGRFSVFPDRAGLLVAPDQEDRIVVVAAIARVNKWSRP
jgi:hypothetical protein